MDTKKEVKKYLKKYFKSQYINENDIEFESLVRLLNKVQKAVKNCSIPPVSNSVCEYCGGWGYTEEGAIAVGCVCEDGKQTNC